MAPYFSSKNTYNFQLFLGFLYLLTTTGYLHCGGGCWGCCQGMGCEVGGGGGGGAITGGGGMPATQVFSVNIHAQLPAKHSCTYGNHSHSPGW